jgi:hypothetical protein
MGLGEVGHMRLGEVDHMDHMHLWEVVAHMRLWEVVAHMRLEVRAHIDLEEVGEPRRQQRRPQQRRR